MLKRALYAGALGLLVFAAPGAAKADSVVATEVFNLNQNSPSNSDCCTLPSGGSFGTVTLTQLTGGKVDVDVELVSGIEFASLLSGNGNSFEFDTNPAISSGQIMDVSFGGTSGTKYVGSVKDSGLGKFDVALDCWALPCDSSYLPGAVTSLTFEVDGVTLSDFTSAVAGGDLFAAQIYDSLTGKGCDPVGDGWVGAEAPVTPEPSSLMLLGSGLAMLAGMLKFKFAPGL